MRIVVVGANRMQGWGMVNSKDGYFSFSQVATHFDDPVPDQMSSWIISPVTK